MKATSQLVPKLLLCIMSLDVHLWDYFHTFHGCVKSHQSFKSCVMVESLQKRHWFSCWHNVTGPSELSFQVESSDSFVSLIRNAILYRHRSWHSLIYSCCLCLCLNDSINFIALCWDEYIKFNDDVISFTTIHDKTYHGILLTPVWYQPLDMLCYIEYIDLRPKACNVTFLALVMLHEIIDV